MPLPTYTKNLKKTKPYLKLTELPAGDYKLRIVMPAIGGWITWKDDKPTRYRDQDKPKGNPDWFLAFYVWDYQQEGLYIMQVSQVGIRDPLLGLEADPDWGDTMEYDIKLSKKTTGGKSSYSVTPYPKKPLSQQIQNALDSVPVCLEALYDGKDPWTDFVEAAHESPSASVFDTPLEKLREMLEVDGVETNSLGNYLDHLVAKHKKPFDKVVDSALLMFAEFKKKFTEYSSKPDQSQLALA